jgi:hypothetical protein
MAHALGYLASYPFTVFILLLITRAAGTCYTRTPLLSSQHPRKGHIIASNRSKTRALAQLVGWSQLVSEGSKGVTRVDRPAFPPFNGREEDYTPTCSELQVLPQRLAGQM